MQLPEDRSLGPLVSTISDFSLQFEEVVLRLLPSGSFLFFMSATVLYYRQRPARIQYSRLLWIKLVRHQFNLPTWVQISLAVGSHE